LDTENLTAWEIFQRMQSQSRFAGMGSYIGIDFNLFDPFCRVFEVPLEEQRLLLDKLLILNSVAVTFAQRAEEMRKLEREAEAKKKRR
jgi:hypothetical protein